MNSKLLSIIAVFIGICLPMKMQAQGVATDITAPEFTFEGDNLVMTCETQGAIIYYSMSEFTDDDEAYDLADNMEVNEYTGTAYTEPIPVTKNVVIKAIAKMPQMQEGSDYKVLIYNYMSWTQLLEAIDYGTDVLNRAQNNPNVSDDLKDDLKWMLEEGEMFYQQRGMMYDSYEAIMIRQHILEIAHQIEEIIGPAQTDPEPYAVLSQNNTVLTFYYDTNKADRNGMSVGPFGDLQSVAWRDYREQISSVVFDQSFANCTTLSSLANWFAFCSNLTTITGLGYLKTNSVTDMNHMFYRCSSLTGIELNGFNTEKVSNMNSLFEGCSGLTSLDVSGFNTSSVTNMSWLFEDCSSLTSLDISGFNTSNVTDMRHMFVMCSALKTIYAGKDWSTASVGEGSDMFNDCYVLVGGAGTHYDANHTDYTYAHIDGGTANPGYFTASGAEPWKDIDAVVLTGKNANYWYDVTGSDPNGEEAIIFTIPDIPEEGMEWEFNILGTFIQNQLAFTTEDGQAINNIIGDILFETKGNMVAIQDGKMLIYESENEQGEIAMVDPNSGMIRIINNEITQRLLNDPNSKFMALPLCVMARQNGRDITVTNGSFTVLVGMPKQVQEAEPYAVLSQNNTVLTFYYDEKKAERNGMGVGPFEYLHQSEIAGRTSSGWSEHQHEITNVVFDNSFSNCTTITSTAYWFFNFLSLVSITGINNLKTDNVMDMECMFVCPNLTSLDVTGFKTDKVMDMSGMFSGCRSLTSIDVRGFKTDNVKDMSSMFADCSGLTSLDVTGFNTQNVTDMNSMFSGCSDLTSIDVSNFNTDNVTEMWGMFQGCSSLTSLDVRNFKTDNVTTMTQMFMGCSNLMSIDVRNFNTEKVWGMSKMFQDCSRLTSLDISNFKTGSLQDMWEMFMGCNNLVNLNLSNFNTSRIEYFGEFFEGCSSLASIQAGSANIPAEEYARIGNPNLLVYVNEASLAPQGVQNVVINGQAKEIILTDVTEGNNNWHCPQAFTAEKISYTRNFKQQTEVGISRGWESIALPFTVQTITHETQGQIIPFGAQGNGKYFWLRGYSPEGLHRATVLEANKPYVISMPNNPTVYYAQYNLNGRVTFEAENTTVPATPDFEDMIITRDNITMAPIFITTPRDEMVYAINVGQPLDRYADGSVFARELREVRPFEAATTHEPVNGARPNYIRIAAQPDYDVTGIVSIENGEWGMENGEWFGLDGRKLSGEPKTKGVYIQNGKKRVVR